MQGASSIDSFAALRPVFVETGIWELGEQVLTDPVHAAHAAELQTSLDNSAIIRDGLDPASYSWFNEPAAIHNSDNGYTYITSIGGVNSAQSIVEVTPGNAKAASYKLLRLKTKDDHCSAPFLFLQDGRLFTTYSGHNDDSVWRYRIGTSASIGSLGAELTNAASAVVAYSQLFLHGNELTWLSRVNSARWDIQRCLDTSGASFHWETVRTLFSHTGFLTYLIPGRVSNDIVRGIVFDNPSNDGNSLRLIEINLATGLVYAGATQFGYLDGSAAAGGAVLPALFTSLPVIKTIDITNRERLLAVKADGSAYLYALMAAVAAPTTSDYWLARLTGGDASDPAAWTHSLVCSGGALFGPSEWRPGGGCFANETHSGLRLYLARESGGTWTIERWDSAAGDGSDWSTTTVASSSHILARPVSPLNAHASLPVLWQEMAAYTSLVNYTTKILWSS